MYYLRVHASENSFPQKFLDQIQDKFQEQHVDLTTNYTPQKDGAVTETCIDLLLSDNPDIVASVKSAGHLGKSKHVILEAELKIPTRKNDITELVPDFKKADFNTMKEQIGNVCWDEVLYG